MLAAVLASVAPFVTVPGTATAATERHELADALGWELGTNVHSGRADNPATTSGPGHGSAAALRQTQARTVTVLNGQVPSPSYSDHRPVIMNIRV